MALHTRLELRNFTLTSLEEHRVERHLHALERRLVNHARPTAALVLQRTRGQREVQADLRVQLDPHGVHLISHRAAETPDAAVRLAVGDIKRQLERHTAGQRGEPTFGVPSRREPAHLRPNPPGATPLPASEPEE